MNGPLGCSRRPPSCRSNTCSNTESGSQPRPSAAIGHTAPDPGMTASSPDASDGQRTLVVMGASAGGVETLRRVVADLPTDLGAAVCVVLHISPGAPSALASILGRAGSLPCRAVADHEELRAGEILVAPPDRHVVIQDGHVVLSSGPRENGHRPAVDALFRTAAENLKGCVIGVVLSGMRDDGTAGLAVIKANGGLAVVQDPEEALTAGCRATR